MFRLALWRTALWCLIPLTAGWLMLNALEKAYYLPALQRIALLAGVGVCLALIAGRRIWSACSRYGSLAKIARLLDSSNAAFKNRLEAALEFIERPELRLSFSAELVEAHVSQAAGLVPAGGGARALAGKILRGARQRARIEEYLFSALLCAALLFSIADPLGVFQIYQHYRHPLEMLRRERAFRIFVRPGNITILRGDSLIIRAAASLHRPEPMTIHYWQAGKPGMKEVMSYSPNQFEYEAAFRDIENDISYYVAQGAALTDTFQVRVTSNPFVTELTLHYDFPAYTGLPAYETSRDKAVQGLRGSRVELRGKASNPLVSAVLQLGPDSLIEAPLTGERDFSATLLLVRDGAYRIRLKDRWGLVNDDTLAYPITVIPDEPPAIALRFPAPDAQINEQMQQPLIFEIADDFGVTRVTLAGSKERPGGQAGPQRSLTLGSYPDSPAHLVGQYLWDLKDFSLLPDDQVAYRLTVFDNDRISGPKSVTSGEFHLRFPSLKEIFSQEQDRQEGIVADLHQIEEKGEKLRDQVKQMSEALEHGRKMEWEEGRKLEQAVQEQVKMLDQVKQIAKELDESIKQLDQSQVLSREMLDKLAQVHELMEEVASQRMKEIMAELQKGIDKLDRKALAEAMKNMQVSQEQLLDKLDKTLALLENLKLEQQMDHLVKSSEELARQAKALRDTTAALSGEPESARDSLENGNTTREAPEDSVKPGQEGAAADSLAGPCDNPDQALQADSRNREESQPEKSAGQMDQSAPAEDESLEKLEEEARELAEQTNELFSRLDETSKNLEKAGEEALSEKLKEEGSEERLKFYEDNLSRIGRLLREGRLKDSSGPQSEVSRSLRQLHDKMQSYRDELNEKRQQKVAKAMEQAFDDLSYLSERQEDIFDSVNLEPDINHPDVLNYAAGQQDVAQGLASVRDGLLKAARDNFFISNQLLAYLLAATSRSEESVGKLEAETRNKPEALQAVQSSLAIINASLLVLLQDSQNLQQSSSGVGLDQMMAQLEALAERQRKLNEQTRDSAANSQMQGQPMPGPSTGGAGPGEADLMQMLQQMAAEQQAIREQAAQLAEQMAGRKDIPGSNLEGVLEDADKVVEDMLKKGVSPETFERQRRIITRLLDTQKSIQERDSGRERKSETAREYTVQPPEAISQELLESDNRESRLKAILERWKGAYPESFEALVREYFDLLQSKSLEK